ncbi:MAG: NAD(P)-dependent oxidoreductase [Bacillota bacterium]
MPNTVFLNLERLDFDRRLDLSPIEKLTTVTKYDASTDQEIPARVQNQDIVITKELPVGRDLIAQFPPSVKLICEAGTGFNNIDLAAAREKNITVCNVPGYSTEAVAELVFGFILNFARSLSQQQWMIKEGDFTNFKQDIQTANFEVQNKTLGIVCGGSIGQQVMKLALAFNMNILVYNRTPRDWGDPRIQSVSLEELLRQSDFVSIHCPLSEDTKYLINRERLQLMKPTAYIINTSRGPVIKEADLIEALQKGRIAGAALDVQEKEPPDQDKILY